MVVYNRWTGMTGLELVDWNDGIANVAIWGVVYNRWTGMTGLERVDWNDGIANVAVWGVRCQNFSSINFAIFADLLVWPQHHPRKLNSLKL